MRALVTGGAGFIGSNLIGKLLNKNHTVVCADNLSLGKIENIKKYSGSKFKFYEADISDAEILGTIMRENEIEIVYHLAANSDIQKSAVDPDIDYKNTFLTTYTVLDCMRKNDVKKLFFASTSAVYGEKKGLLNEETTGLAPISYYGASKLASESFISSYSYMNDINAVIFRFPNVIGPQLTHGVIYDFVEKLKKNPKELEILGDGSQTKPYMYVEDLVGAIYNFSIKELRGVNLYNIGVETATSVLKIADMVCEAMRIFGVDYHFTGGSTGWKGDVNTFQYDLSKIKATGWLPSYSSDEAVKATLETILSKQGAEGIQ